MSNKQTISRYLIFALLLFTDKDRQSDKLENFQMH